MDHGGMSWCLTLSENESVSKLTARGYSIRSELQGKSMYRGGTLINAHLWDGQ
jgi:hypothetical protein